VRLLVPEAAPGDVEHLRRRLEALEDFARGAKAPPELVSEGSAFGPRGLLAAFEGCWDEGDETLVRESLGSWGDQDPRAIARSLVETARTLGSIECRRETLLFFLWEMDASLAALDP
jgi:hypothetical protein